MSDSTPVETTSKKPGWMRYIPVLLIAAVFALVFALGWQEYLTIDALRENSALLERLAEDLGFFAVIAYALLYAVMIIFVPPSGTIMTLTGGFLLGAFLGTTANVVGATIGASALFLATRTAFGDVLEKRAGPAIAKMEKGFQENAFSYMLFLRLVPAFPFFVVNIAPAFLGVPLRTFITTTALGIIPGCFIYTSLGAGLGSLLQEQDPDLGLIFQPQYLLPILGLALLSLVPIAINKWKARKVG